MGGDPKERAGGGVKPPLDGVSAVIAQADTAVEPGELASTLPSGEWAQLLPRGTEVGRFVITEHLGSGGMGVVYAARDTDLDRLVALKLLRSRADGSTGSVRRDRLLREARALAKLDHPNVITVYEVGVFDAADAPKQVFLAMELVDGGTLTSWLAAGRGWREIVETCIEAGKGLAAAHDRELIHRDFKPDNILVGSDGRVRVTDFGLAAVAAEASRARAPTPEPDAPGALTRTGAVVGTPRYMSPEQHEGSEIDARSDQFSFCVTLYEALFGQPPFPGDSYSALAAAVTKGELIEPPSRRVPAWLNKLLRRGMSPKPADRFASMAELLDALERGIHRRRTFALAAAGVALVGVAAAGWIAMASGSGDAAAAAVCTGASRHMQGVWDADRIARIDAAFKTDPPHVRAVWPKVRRRLDAYRDAWVAAHTEACRATRVHGEQSAEQLERRMVCLQRKRTELRQVAVLLEANVNNRRQAAKLPPTEADLALCASPAVLNGKVEPPHAQVADRVAALRTRHDELRVRYRAGHHKDLAPLLETLVEDVRATGYEPLLAEALYLQGGNYVRLANAKKAVAALRAAATKALATRYDVVAARAWAATIYPLAVQLRKFTEAERVANLARSAIRRLGGDPYIESTVENGVGLLEWMRNRFEPARKHLERAVALREQLYGRDDYRVAGPLDNLGTVLAYMHKGDAAIDVYKRALAIRETALGKNHPDVARTLSNLADQYNSAKKSREGIALLERALAIKELTLGKDNIGLVTTVWNLAAAHMTGGRFTTAVRFYRRMAEMTASAKPPRWLYAINGHTWAGYNLLQAGDHAAARKELGQAVVLLDKNRSKRTRGVERFIYRTLALARARGGDFKGARKAAEHAIAMDSSLRDPKHKRYRRRAIALGVLGRVEAQAGNANAARRHLERATKLWKPGDSNWCYYHRCALEVARSKDVLARLLWSTPASHKHAMELARAALSEYVKQGGHAAHERSRLAKWIKQRAAAQ